MPQNWAVQRWRELALAFALMTRLPRPKLALTEHIPVGNYAWAFPLAGLAIGALSGIALWLARQAGASPPLAALAALAASLIATGALHEDGLADFWDGIGGGRTRARKLEIMRDSSIGAFGAAALFMGLAIRWAALADIAEPGAAISALVLAHTAGRGLLALIPEYWRPARSDGLAAGMGGTWVPSAASLLLTIAICALFAPPPLAVASLVAATAAILAVGAIAGRYLGGFTGDVLGAAEQSAEALVLATASVLLAR